MQNARFKWISIVIGVSIVVTILTQGYWNYRNYHLNKQRFLNDMQVALDDGVESYYANLAKVEMIDLTTLRNDSIPGGISYNFSFDNHGFDTLVFDYKGTIPDSSEGHIVASVFASGSKRVIRQSSGTTSFRHVISQNQTIDTLPTRFADLASKVLISLSTDSVDISSVEEHVRDQLNRKDLPSKIELAFTELCCEPRETKLQSTHVLEANAAYLPPDLLLHMGFANDTWKILQMGLVSLLISLTMSAMIIWGLLYLYRVIKNQKQLAELKNDLINNLTHEFKTPIATIATALEGLEKFNETNDLEKTRKYLGIGQDQLAKLDQMVEKLLETATLEKDEIELQKESVDLSALLKKMIEKFSMVGGKQFESSVQEGVVSRLDPVLAENAISNLVDNAIKYGGDQICIKLEANSTIQLEVIDDGPGIGKQNQDKVFEKFYRIPKGDQHDVKGYGIGLYFSKKIIEKHGGTLGLTSRPGETKFKISLP